jgi:predicted TIM-barrel fold metal-dependent hydrolase
LVLYRNTVKDDGAVDLLGQRYPVKVQPRNDEVVAAVATHPDRFWGWVFVNPTGPVEPAAEAERCLATAGMIGVKAHPFWHNYPVRLLMDVAGLCEELHLPMLIHLGTGENGDFQVLPQNFPRLKVIYAHAGIPYQTAIQDYARSRDNVFVDFASTEYVDVHFAREAIRRAGAEKCLFGTDGPYFHVRADRETDDVARSHVCADRSKDPRAHMGGANLLR